MQVVHGLWTTTKKEGPGLVLWFEDSELRMQSHLFEPISDFQTSPRIQHNERRTNNPEQHPFALDPKRMEPDRLAYLFKSLDKHLQPVTLTLNLPSFGEMPTPSPWLRSDFRDNTPEPGNACEMGIWQVPGLFLNPLVALKWLYNLNPIRRSPNMVYARSVKFWKEAANLVFYCLIHGTYEPLLVKEDPQIQAKWVLNDKILANQLDHLQKLLPPMCESVYREDGTRRTRETIIRDFFDTSIDSMIRNVAGPVVMQQLPQTRNSRRRKKQNPLDLLAMPFIKAAYSKQRHFSAARDVQAAFVALVANWYKQKSLTQTKQWRTCFTVIPPEIGNARIEDLNPKARVWRIAFSLQNQREPEQHIYAQEIWTNTVPTLGNNGDSLAEQLLRDLGRALPLFPDLRKALDHAFPTHLDLTTEQVYRFLSEVSGQLAAAEFGVVTPSWWKKDVKPLKTKLKIDGSVFNQKGMFGFNTVVDFAWKAAIGETTLSDEAFQKMVKHKISLLPVNGQWVEVKPEDLMEAITFFEENEQRGKMTLMDAMHLGLEKDDLKSAMENAAFDYEGMLSQLFANETESLPEIEQPKQLNGTLRPYQKRGMSWLSFHMHLGFGACLADDMGLGKTIQLLSLLLYERESPKLRGKKLPTLLVCPMSVVGNWNREADKFAPSLTVLIHHGSNRLNEQSFLRRYKQYDLIITTYNLVNRDFEFLKQIDWYRIALDEAQNIKNPQAQQSQAILGLKAENRIALTGTPVENKLAELWSIMEFLNPGYMGSMKSFQTKFAYPIEKQNDKKKAQLLRQLTQPFILRRLKTDKKIIQDLPEKIEMKVYCDMTEEQAGIYQAYLDQQMKEIEGAAGIMRNQLVLTTLMKLKQICNHPTHFLKDGSPIEQRSGKLMRLEEMLEEALEEGDKSLIFTQFTEMGTILQKYLVEKFKQEVLFMHGGISQVNRQAMVDRFQETKGPRVFILTVKTGGTGLNLTAATHVFHFDRWWNPAVENQATDRAFRIGQKQKVQVHKLIAIGTLEDRIDMMIEKKRELAENIIGSDESWLSQLSTEALREVLTLSADKGVGV